MENKRCVIRMGERHPNAKLTDHEVDLIRHMHEVLGLGYRRLAQMMDVPKSTIRDICLGRTR